jgi:hypothetical protein
LLHSLLELRKKQYPDIWYALKSSTYTFEFLVNRSARLYLRLRT